MEFKRPRVRADTLVPCSISNLEGIRRIGMHLQVCIPNLGSNRTNLAIFHAHLCNHVLRSALRSVAYTAPRYHVEEDFDFFCWKRKLETDFGAAEGVALEVVMKAKEESILN